MSSPSSGPHIFTLTGNLLAERTLEFDGWAAGRTQRAVAESFQVGGKGINVAKMLNRLGSPNTALCFSGGTSGAESEAWLRARDFRYRAFATSRATRTGVVVRDRGGRQAETTLLGADVAPDAASLQACAEFIEAEPGGQVLALCGSFPGWSDASYEPLRRALVRWGTRGQVVADTYGPPLRWAVEQQVALVKINADELAALGLTREALPLGVANWVITDGANPIWFRGGGETGTLQPSRVREVSPTGSGDVLLAGILHARFALGRSLREAVVFAMPYAAANAAHPGVAEFPEPA
jgi:1-phosphofructokinase